ncbi:MAG: hypothetical protein QME83_14490 [Thermodesulfobacteriota bacterium]|nr:hypothetical protein [Thermodesulfobacteriota bacterium]
MRLYDNLKRPSSKTLEASLLTGPLPTGRQAVSTEGGAGRFDRGTYPTPSQR